MKLESFIHNLHFETEKIFPPDWRVDWKDAPLPYKLYRGLPEISLDFDTAWSAAERDPTRNPGLLTIGSFLWHVYGITQYSQSNSTFEKGGGIHQSKRRFVPSGGALYPNEVYAYLKLEDLPGGIYHYSAAHHRLVLLREGNFDSYIARSLGEQWNLEACFGTIFISTLFWKNFYKYHHFSYRLQGLDAGVMIGQLLETAERLGLHARVCYQFLDRPLNHLLGLSHQEESVYAVIPLTVNSSIERNESRKYYTDASELLRELPAVKYDSYQRSKKVIDYPMINKLNAASMFESASSFAALEHHDSLTAASSLETILIPYIKPVSYDFTSICRERHCPENDFIMGNISQSQLASLFNGPFSFTYENDLDYPHGNSASRLALYGTFYQVEGVPNGAYFYDCGAFALRRLSAGDFREVLQWGLTLDNVNLLQVPLCFHIIGNKNHLIDKLGYRGYRIQQMEAGILLQRLLLSAGAIGLGGHPLLGFDAKACDELYQLRGHTSLIQVPVGPYRPRALLQGSLGG